LDYETGAPFTAHTTNPVPFILVNADPAYKLREGGCLADIAPTLIELMGMEQPAEMTGSSLIVDGDIRSDKVMLIILDGWGYGTGDKGDAIYMAKTREWDSLLRSYPNAKLRASGDAVGLQSGKAGNSEAGHTNLGAGRVVLQDDVRMDKAIQDGSFRTNPVFLQMIENARKGGALHLLAYLTEKSSHGCIDYPLMLTEMAEGVEEVYLHIIFDGRSTEPGSAPAMLRELDRKLEALGRGKIVDGVGRGIALDRDGNYPKVRKAYEAMVLGTGTQYTEA